MNISKPKEKLLTCLLILLIVAGMYLLNIPCLFKLVLGISCPGCGMTRAYIRLLHLDIKGAFSYHAMFWSAPILLLFYLFDGKPFKQNWLNYTLSGVVYIGLFANWIVRLVSAS